MYGFNWGRHLGPITGIQRSPHYFKCFITVGDWTARIWSEDYKAPLYISKYHPSYLTDVVWASGRAGIFFISRSDGWLNAYDVCYKTNEYAFSYKIGDVALTSIAINNKGDKLIVGDDVGKVSLLKLSKSFYDESDNKNKKLFIDGLIDRESKREKDIDILLKKKNVQIKDDSVKIAKQEKAIRDKLHNIEISYIPFANEILNREDIGG